MPRKLGIAEGGGVRVEMVRLGAGRSQLGQKKRRDKSDGS